MKRAIKVCGLGLISLLVMYVVWLVKNYKKKIDEITKDRDKLWYLFIFLYKWMNAKISGKDAEKYLEKRGYTNIAIYGMSYLGQTLINDIEGTSISIKYGIDRDAEVYWDTFPIITPDEIAEYDFSEVDVVIVTAISFFDEIRAQLSKELKCPIISIENFI